MGCADDAGMPSRLSLLIHHPPTAFSEQAEAEARQIAQQNAALQGAPAPSGRTDLRHLPLITIDDASAHDFDDALWAEQTADGFHLIVAIADVAHWVKPGSALDEEARERGNSIYLPDKVVPCCHWHFLHRRVHCCRGRIGSAYLLICTSPHKACGFCPNQPRDHAKRGPADI